MPIALRNSIALWAADLRAALSLERVAQAREAVDRVRTLNRELIHENAVLTKLLIHTEADRRAMRDSVVEHMASEEKLNHEISSLKRHLGMAVEQRDECRERKARAKK